MKHSSLLLSIIMLTGAYEVHAKKLCQESPAKQRRQHSFDQRRNAAYYQNFEQPPVDLAALSNGDEKNVPNLAAQFSKALEHDPVTSVLTHNGQTQYHKFYAALPRGNQEKLNAVELAPNNVRVLVNPQAANAIYMEGKDSHLYYFSPAPGLDSALTAAEYIEVELGAICRDVDFEDYGTGEKTDRDHDGESITGKAACVLTSLGAVFEGPHNANGNVTPALLFRGNSAGDKIGPFVSQFLLQPLYPLFPSGCAPFIAGLIGVQNLNQDVLARPQWLPIPGRREFGVSWNDFIAIQNGIIPVEYDVHDYNQHTTRYPITGRDMGGLVHTDGPYQAYYNAMDILTYRNAPISPIFPYANGSIKNEGAGITMGGPDAYDMIGKISVQALKAAWCQKWLVHRRLRPEAFGGLVDRVKTTGENPYGLHESLFVPHCGVDVLEWILRRNQEQANPLIDPTHHLTLAEASTYLLGQMYPEGSPVHPSYPAGHGTVAGACVTVMKAIFDDQAKLKSLFVPVKVDPSDPRKLVPLHNEGEDLMTVGSELDKLASNIALARDFGGVHYRSDSERGILLGERVAISFLQDHARTYAEHGFKGFELTKRNGKRIRITPEHVYVVGGKKKKKHH